MIEFKNVSFSYEKLTVIKDFNLTVPDGKCVCLAGSSGCGKTTVTRILLGLETPQEGTVIRPESISCVFQEDRLINSYSLQKNVKLPLKKEQYPLADSIIEKLGLNNFKDTKPQELSGGMKRRAAIARAIAFGGDALILDEAFNGIDAENKKAAAKIIKTEFLDKGKPVLMITHITDDALLLDASIFNLKKFDSEVL